MVVAVVWILYGTYQDNAEAKNLQTGFDFLDQPAGFPIPSSDFRTTQPMQDAIVEGLKNTLRLSITGIILATVLGTLIGVARLSQNFILRSAAKAYVEIIRNVPLLALVIAGVRRDRAQRVSRRRTSRGRSGRSPCSTSAGRACSGSRATTGSSSSSSSSPLLALWARGPLAPRRRRPHRPAGAHRRCGRSRRRSSCSSSPGSCSASVPPHPSSTGRRVTGGITMTPAYFAALLALVVYTSSHIAEIVRGSIQAVPRGQGEAADALALSGLPADVVRRAAPGDAHRRAADRATSTST